MAKKNLGKFLALTAISTAIAAGVSYFLKYRSFHAELDEDFHDFEGDDDSFDGTLPHEGETAKRNYVPLGEKKDESSVKEEEKPMQDGTDTSNSQEVPKVKETVENTNEQTTKKAEESAEHTDSTTIEEDTSVE